jgi:hypothetical protein
VKILGVLLPFIGIIGIFIRTISARRKKAAQLARPASKPKTASGPKPTTPTS